MSKVYRKPIHCASCGRSIKHSGVWIIDDMRSPRDRAASARRRATSTTTVIAAVAAVRR